MGNRANIVIVEDEDWQLYYSHWAGCRIMDALIAGPDFALRCARSLRLCAKDDWVDPAWADGGAELPICEWDKQPTLRLADDRNVLCHLVSVVDAGGRLRLWPLWWHLCKAWHRPALLDRLPGRGVRSVKLGKIPEGGVHIDVPRKTMGAWQTADTMGIFQALPELWSGWQVECWEDRFEEQAIRCQGALQVPELDLAAGTDRAQAWIGDRVFQSFSDSPAGQIRKLAEMLAPIKQGLVVSDDAAADCAVRPRDAEWARFIGACNLVRQFHAESA